MSQTRRHSALESLTNTIAGLAISFLIQLWIYPFLGYKVTIGQNVFITAIFYVASFIRGYVIRRIFNRKTHTT